MNSARGVRLDRFWKRVSWCGLIGVAAVCGQMRSLAQAPAPLSRAHAHNDYEHNRPLLDALDQGFCSVEADIHLVDGQLLVAHDLDQVNPRRTLQSLYLDPLYERFKENRGRIFPDGPVLTLLIDFKSDADLTYRALRPALKPYRDMLTMFTRETTEERAVTIIVSGNRPKKQLAAEATRWMAYDGRLPDLDPGLNPSRHLVPLVSDNWNNHFAWRGEGPVPEADRNRLERLVEEAHDQGRRIRFWAVPDRPEAWELMWNAGVDLVNTDQLAALAAFMRGKVEGANPSR